MLKESEYRVLIIDDYPHAGRVIRGNLNPGTLNLSCTFHIEEAADKESAIQLLSTQNFHFIIMDYGLPGIDVEELLRLVHSVTTDLQTHIIVMPTKSSLGPPFSPPDHWHNISILCKPFPPAELRTLVKKLIKAEPGIKSYQQE